MFTPETESDQRPPESAEFTCPDCGKAFESPQGLGSHRARAHGYRSKPEKPKRATPKPELDRDKLLGLVAPEGVRSAEQLEQIQRWLDEGARLHRWPRR
jgi:uncharacterized C2H2 Zn-finger protein